MDGNSFVRIFCFIFFFFLGPFTLTLYIRQVKRCRHRIKATVTDMKLSYYRSSAGQWRAYFCYTYNDVDYKATPNFTTSWKRNQVGQEVEIYINEKHPEEYYFPGDAKVLIIVGTIATLIAALIGFSIIKGLLSG